MSDAPRRLAGLIRVASRLSYRVGITADRSGLGQDHLLGRIEVGQLDLFRDEDTAYATELSRAGVTVEFHLHPGVPHEFDSIAFDSDVARRAIADRVRVLKSI